MTDSLEQRVVDIVQDTLRSRGDDPHVVVGANDSMDTLACWDSLTFMTVFLAVNDAFGLDPEFDDAIHYMAVPSLVAYLQGQMV